MKGRGICAALAVLVLAGPALAEGDVEAGEKQFRKCKACHSLEAGKNKIGPHLHSIFGRVAGSVEDYKYSDAMKESGVTWTEETLDAYLEKPKDYIKGNKMTFAGLRKEDQRADLIAYLKQASQ